MNRFNYYGIFLDYNTKNMLMNKLTDNPEYNLLLDKADNIFLDHCTLIHHSQVNENPEKYKRIQNYTGNAVYPVVITHIGYNKKTLAFKVMKTKLLERICANKNPHITIATFNGGKPVESNDITDWEKLDKPIIIKGVIKKICI